MLSRSHLLGTGMHSGKLVFAQVMIYLPLKPFSRVVKVRSARDKVKDFTCLDQFLNMSFTAQSFYFCGPRQKETILVVVVIKNLA